MEAWAIVALVLGSNAIIFLGNWLLMKKQLKHSEVQLEKRLEAQREADKHERQREVRSEPLLKLRAELARMAAKGERVVEIVKAKLDKSLSFLDSKDRFWLDVENVPNELTGALDDWNTYMASGEFQQVLFMQYDVELVYKVYAIRAEYNLARYKIPYRTGSWSGWLDEETRKINYEAIVEKIREATEMVIENRERVADIQSEISKRLEEL